MREIRERPPLWDEIDAEFHVAGKSILFAFGGLIYNPEGGKITRELVAHEAIHGQRQGPDPDQCFEWWRRYIQDKGFRLQEEIPAHQAEYKAYCKRHGFGRDKYLDFVAEKLASPLYGNLISSAKARRIITEPTDWKVVAGEVLHPDSQKYKDHLKNAPRLMVFDEAAEMTKAHWDAAAKFAKGKS